MNPLFVKNPNYSPFDPSSNRYVPETNAAQNAAKKAQETNNFFSVFSMLGDKVKPKTANDFYTPINPASVPAGLSSGALVPLGAQPGTVLQPNVAQRGLQTGALAPMQAPRPQSRVQAPAPLPAQGQYAAPQAPQATPSPLTPQTVQPQQGLDIQALAKQAGEAGLSPTDFMKLLEANGAVSSQQQEAIRTKLGIPNLVDEAFSKPDKTRIDTYRELYNSVGIGEVRTKIKEIDDRISKKRADLVTATGEVNSNPWISQATRAGRLKNLQELAFADINNDIEARQQYMDQYDNAINDIERELGFMSDDQKDKKQLTVDQLNFMLNEAERLQGQQKQDSIASGLRYVPDFLKGVTAREATAQARDMAKIYAQKSSSGGGGGGGSVVGGRAYASDMEAFLGNVSNLIGTKHGKDTFVSSLSRARNDSDKLNAAAAVILKNSSAEIRNDFTKQSQAIANIDSAISLLDKRAQTGRLQAGAQYAFNLFGKDYDPKLTQIGQYITAAVQPYRSSVTGAAWGTQEESEYQNLFGSTKFSPEELRNRLVGVREIMKNKTVNALAAEASAFSGYNPFSSTAPQTQVSSYLDNLGL